MSRRPNAAYLPIAIVFGALGVTFLVLGQPVWVAFFPLAVTFFVLSREKDDDSEDGDEDDIDPVDDAGGHPSDEGSRSTAP